MAGYSQALPALTTSWFHPKWRSAASSAIALSVPEVIRVSVTPRPEARRPLSLAAEPALPGWLEPAIESLLDVLQLPWNWDGYGAAQIQEQTMQQVLMVLLEVMDHDAPAPSVVPLSDGGIQLEWHRHGLNLEIEFPAGEAPSFYYYEDGSPVEREGQISRSYDQIQTFIASLK